MNTDTRHSKWFFAIGAISTVALAMYCLTLVAGDHLPTQSLSLFEVAQLVCLVFYSITGIYAGMKGMLKERGIPLLYITPMLALLTYYAASAVA